MQVSPKTDWIGSTKRWLWRLSIFALAIVGLSIAGVISLRMFTVNKAHKLKAMARDLQTLKPGISSRKEAESIARLYSGRTDMYEQPCTQERCTIGMSVRWYDPTPLLGKHSSWDHAIWRLTALLDNRSFNLLGIQMWDSRAWIHLTGDTVSSFGMQVFVEGPDHGWVDGGWSLYREPPADLLRILRIYREGHGPSNYLLLWHHLHMGMETGEGLEAHVSLDASPEQLRHAFNLNLDCTIKPGGCSSLSELFPDAERDHRRFSHCMTYGAENPDPDCK